MIKLNKRKVINMTIAMGVAYIPLIFPEEPIIITMLLMGMLFTLAIVYCTLEMVTEYIGDKINETKRNG